MRKSLIALLICLSSSTIYAAKGRQSPTASLYPTSLYPADNEDNDDEGDEGGFQNARETRVPKQRRGKKTEENHVEKPIRSLNELMRQHQWLAGLTAGYRFDNKSAVEITVASNFLSFYILPSVSYKHTFPQRFGKWRFYGKVGFGMPWARLKLKDIQNEGVEGIDSLIKKNAEYDDSEENEKQARLYQRRMALYEKDENPDALSWQYDVVAPIISVGTLYPLFSNVFFEVTGNVMYPFKNIQPEAAILPAGLIGSIQLGFRVKLF